MTPPVLSLLWRISVLKWVYSFMCYGLISVRRRYSKSYPSPARSPLSLQCLAGSEMEKVCWFGYLKLTCLCAENVHLSSLQMSSKQWCLCVTHWFRQPRKLRADSAKGEAQCCFFELPHSGEPGPHHVPRIPVTHDPGNSSRLLGSCFSLFPRVIPITLDPAMNRSELGEMG